MISIYPSDEKEFANNGVKILHPLKANIRKEDNGDYYIELKDTINNLEYYQAGLIIRVPTPWGYQGFRLNNPKIENKTITCKGYHLYFDTANYLISDSYVVDKNCNDALDHLNMACDVKTPFSFISDINRLNSYRCIRHSLEEAISVVVERWGGHLVRDNFNIELRENIGQDRGVTLSYGKNITSIKADENWNNVVTKILPVGKDGLTLPEIYIEIEEKLYDIPYSKIVSFDQSSIEEANYQDESGNTNEEAYREALINDLRNQANDYLEENKLPKVNYSVNAYLKDVSDVGDIIYVKHPKCKIDLITNVIAIEYDCISEKYTKIEFGNFKSKLKDLVSNVASSVIDEVSKSQNDNIAILRKELIDATNKIWNAMGNSYVIYDGDKIMIVDKLPKEEAKNVILINNGGIGISQNGINGTFNSAWTIDGTLDMQNINVINLVADMIKGGTLKLGGLDNTNGTVEIYDTNGKIIGKIDNKGFSFLFGESETTIQQIVESIDLFNVDIDTNAIFVYVDDNNKPVENKDYIKEFKAFFKNQEVTATVTSDTLNTGINLSITDNLMFSVNTETPIPNQENTFLIDFKYVDGEETYQKTATIMVVTLKVGVDYTPYINDLQNQLNEANSNLNDLNTTLTNDYMTSDQVNAQTDSLKQEIEVTNTKMTEFQTTIDGVNINIQTLGATISDMSYSFRTDALSIATSESKVNSKFDNTGVKVYNYETLKAIFNHRGSGMQDLIVVGTAQMAYLKFMKSTKKSKPITAIHHVISEIQTLEDLEGDDTNG